jgi:cell wall-associated NlpC family hydrolase
MAPTTSPQTYFPWIRQAAAQYGVPADLLAAQIDVESAFNPNAVSPAGAIGISQFMPKTAAGFGIDPHDPRQSIEGQARYMHQLLEQYGGNVQLALAAYNAGSGNVARAGGRVPSYAQGYVNTVQSRRSRYPGLARGGSAAAGAPTAPGTPIRPPAPPANQPPSIPQSIPAAAGLADSINAFAQQSARSFNLPTPPTLSDPSDPAANPGLAGALVDQLPTPTPTGQPTTPVVSDSSTPLSKNAQNAITLAKSFLGTPYRWGGESPQTGFDCSGLLQYVWGREGVTIPRTSEEQWKVGQHVDLQHLRPGDAVFFAGTDGPPTDIGHVGIYLGDGQFLHAPHTGDVVKISNLNDAYYRKHFAGGRRFTR